MGVSDIDIVVVPIIILEADVVVDSPTLTLLARLSSVSGIWKDATRDRPKPGNISTSSSSCSSSS